MLDSDISPDHQHRTHIVSRKEARRQRILIPFLLIGMVTAAALIAAGVFEMKRRSLDMDGAVRIAQLKWAEYQRANSPVSISRNEGEANPEVVALVEAWPAHQAALPEVKVHDTNAVISGLKKVARQGGDDPSFIPLVFADEVLKALREIQADPTHKATYRRLVALESTIAPILGERQMPPVLRAICWMESAGFKDFEDVQTERLGLWALTPDIARRHGLDLTQRPDPRLDPVMATLAARSYLMELFYQTGGQSWWLAAMAYPEGPGVIQDIRARQDTWTPEELGLWHWIRQDLIQVEQRRYLVKLLAAAILYEEAIAFNIRPVEDKRDWEQY